MATGCAHLDRIQDVEPSVQGCEDCLRIGDSRVHLRKCLTCKYAGCCDDSKSPYRRDTLSFHATLRTDHAMSLAVTVA